MASNQTTSAVLDALAVTPGATAAELATASGLGRSTVAKALAALVADGRVRRQEGEPSGGRRQPDRFALVKPSTRNKIDSQRLGKGELRALVLDHLQSRPGQAVTPTAVAKDLGRSAGAVGNALERLVASGQVVPTGSAPRRYAAAS